MANSICKRSLKLEIPFSCFYTVESYLILFFITKTRKKESTKHLFPLILFRVFVFSGFRGWFLFLDGYFLYIELPGHMQEKGSLLFSQPVIGQIYLEIAIGNVCYIIWGQMFSRPLKGRGIDYCTNFKYVRIIYNIEIEPEYVGPQVWISIKRF